MQMQSTHRKAQSPIALFLVGAVVILMWLMATLLQIQTSEAWIVGGSQISITSANWSILIQPLAFLTGHVQGQMVMAIMWGWGIEAVTLIFAVAAEVALHAVAASHQQMSKLFLTVGLILMALNGYSDFQYGTIASGWWGHFGFSVITSGLAVWGLVIGVRFIEKAITEYGR